MIKPVKLKQIFFSFFYFAICSGAKGNESYAQKDSLHGWHVGRLQWKCEHFGFDQHQVVCKLTWTLLGNILCMRFMTPLGGRCMSIRWICTMLLNIMKDWGTYGDFPLIASFEVTVEPAGLWSEVWNQKQTVVMKGDDKNEWSTVYKHSRCGSHTSGWTRSTARLTCQRSAIRGREILASFLHTLPCTLYIVLYIENMQLFPLYNDHWIKKAERNCTVVLCLVFAESFLQISLPTEASVKNSHCVLGHTVVEISP